MNVKLPHLHRWTEQRRKIALHYVRELKEIPTITLQTVPINFHHVYHLFVIKTSHRDALRAYLSEVGIGTVINYPISLPFLPAYSYLNHKDDDFPVAFSLQSQILSLPIFPEMTKEEVQYVCDTIKGFFATHQ